MLRTYTYVILSTQNISYVRIQKGKTENSSCENALLLVLGEILRKFSLIPNRSSDDNERVRVKKMEETRRKLDDRRDFSPNNCCV